MTAIRRALIPVLITLVAMSSLAVIGGVSATPASAAPPGASFTWSMPDRFGLDANADHVIDEIDLNTDPAFVRPSAWPIAFDACQADGQPLSGATYAWSVGGVDVPASTSCRATVPVPAVDVLYPVTLTVTRNGESSTATESILPRDYVIVAMGDSGASGEGNPDYLQIGFEGDTFGSIRMTPKWNNEQCHRSALAGPAQAALRIEQRDPHSSVTFVHTACSGARITRGLLGPYQGLAPAPANKRLDCDDPNMANPYKPGQTFYIKFPDSAYDAPNPTSPACLPSQVDQVKTILGNRPIDVMNILIGINDISFSKVAISCLADDDCSTVRSLALRDPDNRMQTAAEFLAPRFDQLPDRYAALTDRIMTDLNWRAAAPALGIDAGHVFLGEYPDPSQNDDGSVCLSNEKSFLNDLPKWLKWVKPTVEGFLTGLTVDPDAGTINQTEWAWARDAIIGGLKNARDAAVDAANVKYPGRFSKATGSTAAFARHGYCAKDTWFNNVAKSFAYQHDQEGSLHPNRAGHFYAFALPLEAAWAQHLHITAPALPADAPGEIEALESISQGFAPLFQALGQVDIVAELQKVLGVQPPKADAPGTPSQPKDDKGTDYAALVLKYFRAGVKGIIENAATTFTSKGLAELDQRLDDLDGINGPTNDGQFGPFVLDVEGKVFPHDLTDGYQVVVDISLKGDLGALDLTAGGLSLAGPQVQVDITSHLNFYVRPERVHDRVYLDPDDSPSFRIQVKALQTIAPDAPLTATFGPIDVMVNGPSADTPAVDVLTAIEIRPRDVNGNGEISSDELIGSGSFDVACAAGSYARVNLKIRGAIGGLQGDLATLALDDANVCDGVTPPAVQFANPDFADLETLTPDDVLAAVAGLARALEQIGSTGEIDLPFTSQELDRVVEVAAAIRSFLADPATAVKPSLQRLLTKLETALGVPAGTFVLTYDQANHRFLFTIAYQKAVAARTVPVDLGLLTRVGLVDPSANASVTVDASASVNLTVALDVSRQPDGTPTEQLRTISDRVMIGRSSSIAVDASASLSVDAPARIGIIPVNIAIGDGSGGPRPLVAKRDPARPLVRFGLAAGAGDYVSLAQLGAPGPSPLTVDVNARMEPVTASVRATLNGAELATGSVTVSWNDLSMLTGPDGPQVTADAAFGRDLLRFADAANDPVVLAGLVLAAVRDSADAVTRAARQNEQLARSLPLVGAGYDDIVAGFTGVSAAATQLLNLHQALTLPNLEAALEQVIAQALGVTPASVADVISFELDRSQPRTALVLHVNLCRAGAATPACASVRPISGTFSFDTTGGANGSDLPIVGATGSVALVLDYLAQLRLDVGVELPAVLAGTSDHPEPVVAAGEPAASLFVLGSSGATADLRARIDLTSGGDGTFRANVGPYQASLGIRGTKGGAAFSDPAQASASVRFAVTSGGPATERLSPAAWLAKVAANLDANGVTDHSGAWTPADCPTAGQEGCATLPVYLKTASGDVTAGGAKWVKLGTGPITFTAARLTDPSTFVIVVPPSIATDLASRALSVTSVIEGVRYLVAQAKAGLDGSNIGQSLPIIGKAYSAGSAVLTELDSVVAKFEQIAATVESATTAGNLQSNLRNWLYSNLGPSGLKLVLDANGSGTITIEDVTVLVRCGDADCAPTASLLDVTDVRFSLALGKNGVVTAPRIDWGVPGLRISTQGTATGSASWRLELRGGVDRSGFYLDPVGTNPELSLNAAAGLPDQFDATIAGLPIRLTDNHAGDDLQLQFGVDLLPDADSKLRLGELVQRGADMLDPSSVALTARGCADLQTGLEVRVPGSASNLQALPGILADLELHADWNGCPGTATTTPVDVRQGLAPVATMKLKNVRLDAGRTAANLIAPVLRELDRYTGPVQPIARAVSSPIPVVSDLSRLVGKGDVTWLQAWAASEEASGNDVTAIVTLVDLINFAHSFNAGTTPQIQVPIVDDITIDLAKGELQFPTAEEALTQLVGQIPAAKDVLAELQASGWTWQEGIDGVADETHGAEFTFPAFEEPIQFLQLLFGKDVDLARFDAGTLRAERAFDVSYGLPFAKVGVRGHASIDGHLSISYDTAGIRRALAVKPLSWSSLGALVHGVGIDDLDEDGNDRPEIHMEAALELYAYAGVPGVSVQAYGGVGGNLDLDLRDPDGDGKVRFEEVKARLRNPICLFQASGKIEAYARVKIEAVIGSATKDIVDPYTLFEFPSMDSWCDQQESSGGAGFEIPQPILASQVGTSLYLNVGNRAVQRQLGGDGPEAVNLVDLGDGSVVVTMMGYTQTYGSAAQPVNLVSAIMGNGDDSIAITRTGTGTRAPVTLNVQGGPGNDSLLGSTGNDTLMGDAGDDIVNGNDGNDIIIGGDADDRLKGGNGNDTINGDAGIPASTGDDIIDGGNGDDLISPHNGRDTVTGGAGNDSIRGESLSQPGVASGPDYLDGGTGKDSIEGSGDGDVIIGGVEPLVTVGIVDYLDGKGGDDCIIADAGYGALPEPGTAPVCVPTDTPDAVAERDNVRGGQGSDTIWGQAGDDYLSGDDQIGADTGADVIDGGLGNDELHGSGGNDVLTGGVGNDDLWGEAGDDTLDLGVGNDEGRGGPGADTITGGDGDDLIHGWAASNSPIPDGGDEIDGGNGVDTVTGGPGDDTISGGAGNDSLTADDGNDTVSGGAGDDLVDAGAGNDVVYGDDGNDKLTGRAGDDRIDGGAGDDLLAGDATSTSLASPPLPDGSPRYQSSTDLTIAGSDTLIGGSGANMTWDTELADPWTERHYNLTLTITQPATKGITNGNATGFVHLPTAVGSDEVRFQLLSNGVVVNTGRLVLGPLADRAPVARDDFLATPQGVEVAGSLLANDSDPDGDALSVVAGSGTAAHGTWQVSPTGVFRYQPDPSFAGADSVSYQVQDRFGLGATGTVWITVVADTAAPLVGCLPPAGWSGAEVTVPCTASDGGVGLADPADAERSYTTAGGPGHEGPVTIDPAAVCDRAGNCADEPAFAVLVDRKGPQVTSANEGRTYTFGETITKDVHCTDDGSGLAEATCTGHGDALPGTAGAHSFSVTATDKVGNVTTLTVSYTVTPPANGQPVAEDDSITIAQGGLGETFVLENDSDPDGDELTPVAASGTTASGGVWHVFADGDVTYQGSPTYAGPSDSFTYTVTDGKGGTDTAMVIVTIVPDLTAPVVSCDGPEGWQGQDVTVVCHADDLGTGLADPLQAIVELTTAMGQGNEGVTSVDPPSVCDKAGNCTDLEPLAVAVDMRDPSITSANDLAVYAVGQVVTKDVHCSDGGSGLAPDTCLGNGEPLDTSTEGTHTFTITAVDNVGLGATKTVTYVVKPTGVVVSIGDGSVVEGNRGNRTLHVAVTLSAPAKKTVKVTVAVAAGSATAGVDYVQPKRNLTVTIPAGKTVGSVSVSIRGDRSVEQDETISVRIVSATGASVGRAAGTGTILDDDSPVTGVSVGDVRVVEGDAGNRVVLVPVALADALKRSAVVTLTVAGVAQPVKVQFRAGETVKTVAVTIIPNRTAESDRVVKVSVVGATNVGVARAVGTVTVLDDDRSR